jgi:hypothetical protein
MRRRNVGREALGEETGESGKRRRRSMRRRNGRKVGRGKHEEKKWEKSGKRSMRKRNGRKSGKRRLVI